jgi:hypothetical protein
MAERLTDAQIDGFEVALQFMQNRNSTHVDEARSLLTEVRERRAAEQDDAESLAELDAIGAMTDEECNRELEKAGIDVALWASSTKALVKACTERNAAFARIAGLEACLRECIGAGAAIGLFDLGEEHNNLAGGSPEQIAVFHIARGVFDRARAALAKGESK